MKKIKSILNSIAPKLRRKVGQAVMPPPTSVDDIVRIVRSASNNSVIDFEVHDIIERVLSVSELRVRDVMIPNVSMVTIAIDSNFDEILETVTTSGHSRFPVIEDLDKPEESGILLAKDILGYRDTHSDESFSLHDLLREAIIVPESMRLYRLLKRFQEKKSHMAIVVSEYNSIAGLVTIEDVLEQIVGEIEDESDLDGSEMIIEISKNRFRVNGQTDIEEFNEHVNANIEDDADTIGGFILKMAQRVPEVGDTFEHDGLVFEVANADKRRIVLLRVSRKDSTT